MTDLTAILNKVKSLEAWSAGLHEEAVKVRKSLEGIVSPAPRKGRNIGLSDAERASLIARSLKRRKIQF